MMNERSTLVSSLGGRMGRVRLRRAAVFSIVLIAALSLLGNAGGDVVYLKNGSWVEGSIIEVPGGIRVRMEQGSMTISKDQVERVEKKVSWLQVYREKERETAGGSAEDHYRLGLWCRGVGLGSSARLQFRLAIREDPDHAGARTALGHVLHDGVWMTKEEVLVAKGYLRERGRWVSPEEQARRRPAPREERQPEWEPVAPGYPEARRGVVIPVRRCRRARRGGTDGPVIVYSPGLVVRRGAPPPSGSAAPPPLPSGVPSRWQERHRRAPPPPSGVPSRGPVPGGPTPPPGGVP